MVEDRVPKSRPRSGVGSTRCGSLAPLTLRGRALPARRFRETPRSVGPGVRRVGGAGGCGTRGRRCGLKGRETKLCKSRLNQT